MRASPAVEEIPIAGLRSQEAIEVPDGLLPLLEIFTLSRLNPVPGLDILGRSELKGMGEIRGRQLQLPKLHVCLGAKDMGQPIFWLRLNPAVEVPNGGKPLGSLKVIHGEPLPG